MTASTSSVMSSPREGKRSFSSTIKSFFLNSNKKRLSNKKLFTSDIPYANHLDDSDSETTLHVRKRKRMAGTSQHNERVINDNSNVPIIIYGAEGTERPPVLPILPIQRLRLLREKQKLRNMRDLRLLQAFRSPSVSSSMFVDPQNEAGDKESYIRTSTTPSPIKKTVFTEQIPGEGVDNTGIKLPLLKSLKNKASREKFQSQSKGTVWSANFEYDLSEYDTMQKQQNSKNVITTTADENKIDTSNNDNKNNDVNGDLAGGPTSASNFEDLRSDINSSRLSNSQKNLLLNGSTSTVTKHAAVPKDFAVTIKPLDTPTLKKIAETKKDKESIVLPTIGFDFIKDNETPSKKTSPVANVSTDTVINANLSDIHKPTNMAEIPKLSFNTGQKINEPKKTEQSASSSTLFNFGGKSDASSIKKPFSFGKASEREEMPMKPQAPAFSFSKPAALSDVAPKSTAAAFSFGKHEKNDEQDGDDSNDDNEPRRKRRAQTNESVNAGSLFSLDNQGEANKGEPKIGTSEKPSFTFGSSNKQVESGPSFAFGKKPDENGQTKSPIAFTFGKPVVAKEPEVKSSETLASVSGKPSFTFGQSTSENEASGAHGKPAFSFGKSAMEPKSGPTSNSAPKPLFTFGSKPADIQTLPDNTTSKPTLSFSKPVQEDSSTAPGSKMPSFAFGASSNPSQQKSSFSFGKPEAAKEPTDSKSSFTFTKPFFEKTETKGAPSFTFGAPATNPITENSTKPSFSFGAPKPTEPSAVVIAGSTNKTSGGFSFSKFDDKKENSATATPLFKRSASTTPVSALGKPIGTNNNTSSKTAFSFGTANTEATNAAPTSTPFSFNGPTTDNITSNTISSISGTNIVGGFNLGKRAQSSAANSDASGESSRFSLARPGTTVNSITSDQPSFNFGSNSTAGPNPFTSAAPSNNTGLFNKPVSTGAQSTNAPSSFNFTGNNPASGSVFNMNNNTGATTMFGGSSTNLSQQSQNTSFNANNSFTPSTVPNIHFGGFDGGNSNSATGALKPSDIFGGNSASGSNVNGINPSSVFGGSDGAPSFGQPQAAPNQMGMNTGMNMGMNLAGNGGMTNRKIARMRHTKR
ncbi:hypothetical protein SEUBUCD646_0H01470 [Saccharomyces eubayanus]|uniref:NUP1-like protein n=1 Tax=Saccharomyces eubayanus TaxID=1080349 RepID=A0ABN8VR57_SACEU|nr:hypothetical protein SEUBUCD650_0H01480 [Saccharomyces eubayanus]CAI2037868.1 hypothetical protein SEUBUCD646_0H01470 [Saccharomyces eubayanus]